jgi:hypothetical protein
LNYYITEIKKAENKINTIRCFDSELDEDILTPRKWYIIPIDLFVHFMQFKKNVGYFTATLENNQWLKGKCIASLNDLEKLPLFEEIKFNSKKPISKHISDFFKKRWENIKNKQNHFIQAQLIGRYWFDPLQHMKQEQIDKPRKRKVICLSKKNKGDMKFYTELRSAESIMKFEDYELNTIVETLAGTSRIEKRGMQTLIDLENKKTATDNEIKNLKEYAVLHFVRSKKIFNITNKNLYKFNKEVLFGRKKRLDSIKNYNLYILGISNMQFFLTDNIVTRFETEEINDFKNHLNSNLNTFLLTLLREFVKDESQFEIYKLKDDILKLCLISSVCNGILNIPHNPQSILLVENIINKFTEHFYSCIFFIYHPTRFIYLTPHSVHPRGGFAIAALGDFLIKHMLKNNGKFVIMKDISKQAFVEKYIKDSKITME